MQIQGKFVAEKIYQQLRDRVGELQKKQVTPHLAVILVGNDPRSLAYVSQKQNRGNKINAIVIIHHYDEDVTTETLVKKIHELNSSTTIHGILIQRPLPKHIDEKKLEFQVDPQKDIDGFHPDSPYILPLPLAVLRTIEELYFLQQEHETQLKTPHTSFWEATTSPESDPGQARMTDAKKRVLVSNIDNFFHWLAFKRIVILGKGPIGGKPIIEYFTKLGLIPIVIDSKTPDAVSITKKADIIISAVGREHVITPEMISPGVILIGVGLFQGSDKKLHGDYDEEAIKTIAGFYTSTPGGIGPVNIAMLMDNLVTAAEKQTSD